MTKNRARVVGFSVMPDGNIAVEVTCPNGCKRGPRVDSKPQTHHHGWYAGQLERSPHCGRSGAPSYTLWWPDMPAHLRDQVPA